MVQPALLVAGRPEVTARQQVKKSGASAGQSGCSVALVKIRSQKGLTTPKNRTNSTKEFLNDSRGYQSLPSKTRVLRQIAPESSLERSAKSLSHSFFVVPFLSLKKMPLFLGFAKTTIFCVLIALEIGLCTPPPLEGRIAMDTRFFPCTSGV